MCCLFEDVDLSLSLKLKFVWALIFTFLSRILSENFCALLWFLQSTKAPHGPVICLLASADGIWIIKMKCILWIYWFCMHPPQITLKVFASVCFLLLFYSFVSFRIFFPFLEMFLIWNKRHRVRLLFLFKWICSSESRLLLFPFICFNRKMKFGLCI